MIISKLFIYIFLSSSLLTSSRLTSEVPTVITLAKEANKNLPFVLFISGDGGWYEFDQEIADKLASKGYNIIGVDAKKYFWKKKSIAQTTKEISDLIDKYQLQWNQPKVVLIGYSMGASVMPFVYENFTKIQQENVTSLVLLSPVYRIDFEIKYAQMLGYGLDKAENDVTAEIKNSKTPHKYNIFIGETEDSKLRNNLKSEAIRMESLPGDHYYLKDYEAISKAILSCKIH